MICTGCGAQADNAARFCANCGAGLRTSAEEVASARKSTPRKIILVVAGILLAVAIYGGTQSSDRPTSSNPSSPSATPPTKPSQPVEPPLTDVTVHPYDLLKNPYNYKNRIVVLNVMEKPVLYNNSVIQYAQLGGADPRVATQLGIMGLRLNRMMSETTALYDIMGVNASTNSDSEMLGQIAVFQPEGRADLELWRKWEVEPLGTLEGTNGFGAPIEVPEVRFWRYADERSRSAPTTKLSGDGAKAVDLVKDKDKADGVFDLASA